jgi:hypothetical protein
MKRVIYILLTCSFLACHVTAQTENNLKAEKELVQHIDRFMTSNADKFDEFQRVMNAPVDTTAGERSKVIRNNAFITSYLTFAEQHAADYRRVRTAKFSQFGPPPASLLALHWDTVSTIVPELKGNDDLLSVIFIRMFDPVMAAEMVQGLVMGQFMNDSGESDLLAYYRTRELFGSRIYVKAISNDVWQVWAADRSLAISFRFNVSKGQIMGAGHTKLKDPAYAAIQWPASIVQPADNTVRLTADIAQVMWDTYPGQTYKPEDNNVYQQKRTVRLYDFMQQNRQRYQVAREEQLRQLDAPPAALTGYKEVVKVEDDIMQASDSVYLSSMIVYPQQCESIIGPAASTYTGEETQEVIKRVQQKGLFGSARYAKKLNNQEWEVWAVSAADAMRYHWNTASGQISQVQFWLRE